MKQILRPILLLLLFGCPYKLYSQRFDQKKLEETLSRAIEKAYPASVRIWGYDVTRQMQTSGQFSGVVVSAEGHILTAAHVSVPNKTYKVMFPDGTTCIARGLGKIEFADNKTIPDVAMMKISGRGKWPYAEMGYSSALKKDEPCISIAYPESLNQSLPTVRFGHIADLKNKLGFIQSTCIMEPGDSGGPLFDVSGRVIGLHSAIDVPESDNFEIPVDLYRKYWTALNTPETYTSLPATEDRLESDPFTGDIPVIHGLEKIESNFKELAAQCRGNSFQIKSQVKGTIQNVQGTLFSMEGISLKGRFKNNSILISKNSMVGEMPVLELDGHQIAATVVARDKENDLVLLYTTVKMEGGISPGVLNADTLSFKQLGKFLISPLSDQTYKIGVLGSLEFSLQKITSSAYLGADVELKQGWVTITGLKPNSPASDSKLKTGDQVLAIDGLPIDSQLDYTRALQRHWPDDQITIKLLRADSAGGKDVTLLKEVVLATRPPMHFNHPAELFEGGKSIRRDGFERVFSDDTRLLPEQCGGPVFDTAGHFYGINISRFSRVSSIVIPADVISRFIKQWVE
ncbi:S1C family serine protease [Pedobacter sp. L105]|uniref:S1C family serine protease n=1 Tax=Pedobacter sp. L105 TaxID=1641871 RepID=UPI00131CBF66|nr:trypsin-like peptidase domain-containing protein [Pedobacter sp. L105]